MKLKITKEDRERIKAARKAEREEIKRLIAAGLASKNQRPVATN